MPREGPVVDLTGQCFGRLTVACFIGGPQTLWKCVCACGQVCFVRGGNLRDFGRGKTRSCGCLALELTNRRAKGNRYARLDLSGMCFGRLLALRCTGQKNNNGSMMWECRCDCGNTVTKNSSSLRTGWTKSCGCLKREISSKTAMNLHNLPSQLERLLERAQSLSATFAHGNAYERFQANKGEVENGNQGSSTA